MGLHLTNRYVVFFYPQSLLIKSVAVMLSIAKSRYTSISQFTFLILNAVGLLTGVIYNTNTPELYEGNAHHKIGWIATWIMSAHTIIGLLRMYTKVNQLKYIQSKPINHRRSHDRGLPASPQTSGSQTPVDDQLEQEPFEEKDGLLGRNSKINQFVSSKIHFRLPSQLLRWINLAYEIVDRSVLILGFVALTTGFITYGAHFKGHELLSGLAHFVKGGVFFWYGLLCLGRVMGSFSDLGWSWNVKLPVSMVGPRKAATASAEFFESLLIFIYGAMNVFLEHLESTDGKWSVGDLEHAAISVMFFGGGLCGMLIESKRVRDLLNSAFISSTNGGELHRALEAHHEPRSYGFSTNPMPAIVILLLGMMMSSHTQVSPVSTMMHKLWGTLFFGAAIMRGITYLTVYMAPPTSYLPSRPPSEIVVAFCFISGGLLFMSSASDIISGMEMYEIHAMILFTMVMGFTAFLMAWEIMVLAIKGWAVRQEHKYQPTRA